MTIQFLTRSLYYGGAERHLVELAKGLSERGHSVRVAVLYGGGALAQDLHDAGVPVVTLDKRGRWDVLGFLRRLLRCVRREKPDVVYGYLSVPNLLTILLKPLFPRTRMVWWIGTAYIDLTRYDWLWKVIFKTECAVARLADLIIVNSHAGREYHLRYGFPGDRMIVIPNGCDVDHFRPDARVRERVRSAWAIEGHEKVIGLVARIDPMKDHPTFLDAVEILAAERDDVRFVCIGDGREPYRSEVMRLSSRSALRRRVVWIRKVDEIADAYNAMDILSLTSYGEGLPTVIGEAMACGVPCVVTDVGDAKSMVADTGLVVPPSDPEALARAWTAMLDRLSASDPSYRERIRRRVVEQFSAGSLVDRTEAALQGLVQGDPVAHVFSSR